MSRTRWRTCACGLAFRSYTFDRCEDCRAGRRETRRRFRAAVRGPHIAAHTLRLYQQHEERRKAS